MHIVIDVFRTWLLVKVYKLAYGRQMITERKMHVYAMILFQAKYKFCSVLFNFNDTIVHLVALASIYYQLKGQLGWATFFMGFASSIKFSAFLYLPGCLLVAAQERNIFAALIYFVGVFAVQILFGLEFLLKNAKGYLLMAYDFDRKFAQSESINFQYWTEEFAHSKPVEKFLIGLHLLFLIIFLVFKWTGSYGNPITLFRDVRLWPCTPEVRQMNKYNIFLIIATSNFIGMTFSRGTH
jgi:alpha-1,3-mannosyltransferase